MSERLDYCESDLQKIDELCAGRSEHIDKNLPAIVAGFDILKKTVNQWIEGL